MKASLKHLSQANQRLILICAVLLAVVGTAGIGVVVYAGFMKGSDDSGEVGGAQKVLEPQLRLLDKHGKPLYTITNNDPNAKDSVDPQVLHFVQMVRNELAVRYGRDKAAAGNYTVKTTLDPAIQTRLSDSLSAQNNLLTQNGADMSAGVAINPKTGGIMGMVGNTHRTSELNLTTTAIYENGQLAQPFVYALAMDKGLITESSTVSDTQFSLGEYELSPNFDGRFMGDMTVRDALGNGRIMPAARVAAQLDAGQVRQFAERLDFGFKDTNGSENQLLGLGLYESSLVKTVGAYAMFANDGNFVRPHAITSITDNSQQREIYRKEVKPQRAVSVAVANTITSILSDQKARSKIYASSLTIDGHPEVAVKTGFLLSGGSGKISFGMGAGYTDDVAVGVWVGREDDEPLDDGAYGLSGKVWRGTMEGVLAE